MFEFYEFDCVLFVNIKLFVINYDVLFYSDLVVMLLVYKIILKVIEVNEDILLFMVKFNYLFVIFIIGFDGRVRDIIMGEVMVLLLV